MKVDTYVLTLTVFFLCCIKTLLSSEVTLAVREAGMIMYAMQVNSLAFDPHTPSMLACGTNVGEVMLYDITNPLEPRDALAAADAAPSSTVVPYAPQFRSGPGEVLSLKFNNVSPHIIAIGFANGATHLYDSRNRRKVLEFVDENLPRRIAGVAWAPSDETHLVLASADDRSPTLQFWDLRKVCH